MNAATRRAIAVALLATGGASACGLSARLHPKPPTPDPATVAWAEARDSARAAIAAGRYAQADTVLTAFRAQYANAPGAADALYWRALARFGAGDPAAGVRPAVADLDAYRATAAPEHQAEAITLRRALVRLDSARTATAVSVVVERPAVAARAGLVPRDSLRARDEELARVKAEALATQLELDRLRRRLAAPGRRP